MRPRSPYLAFHRDEHLLLQFVVKEFIFIMQSVKQIESTLLQNTKEAPSSLESIKPFLKKLLGGLEGTVLVWSFSEGRLAKLKGYCTWLLKEASFEDKPFFSIDQIANQAWIFGVKSFDLLQSKRGDEEILNPLKKLISCLHRFSKTLPQVIRLFLHDENVLLFILNHQQELNDLYQTNFTKKLLLSAYPKGLKDAEILLKNRYKMRGFSNLFPKIEQLFLQLN